MTRKDYVLLARALADAKPQAEGCGSPERYVCKLGAWMRSVEEVCRALASDNYRFDRQRFLTACCYDLDKVAV